MENQMKRKQYVGLGVESETGLKSHGHSDAGFSTRIGAKLIDAVFEPLH